MSAQGGCGTFTTKHLANMYVSAALAKENFGMFTQGIKIIGKAARTGIGTVGHSKSKGENTMCSVGQVIVMLSFFKKMRNFRIMN